MKNFYVLVLFALFASCSKEFDEKIVTDIINPRIKVYVDPKLTPDTALVGEYITVSDTNTNYNPQYELYLGTELDFIFFLGHR